MIMSFKNMNFICFLLITWLKISFALQLNETNLAEKYNKCLRPLQVTNFSLDGISNCTCIDGYDYDSVFGHCFKNKCKEICGEMSCSILKHAPNDFEYYCYCEPGYTRIDPYEAAGCRPIDHTFAKLIESSKEDSKLELPLNPFLAQQLNCSQKYVLTSTGYECRCHNGYRMISSGECKKVGSYVNYCKDNQILALDDFDQIVCKCKPGYGGKQCEYNFCHWPSSTPEEKEYFKKSTESFCGLSTCRLAYDRFKCSCPESFSKEDKEGKCQLFEDCSENQNHGKCSKDKLCKINTSQNRERAFDCKCPIELQNSDDNSENCKQIEQPERCLPGYLPNPDMRKEYRQKCVKGYSSFNLKFQIRLDLSAGNNSELLLANYFDLEQDLDLNKIPENFIKQFVAYKDNTLIYTMDRVMNKNLIKMKISYILENAFALQLNQHHFNKNCYYLAKLDFDHETFSLVRIDETLINVNLTVTCRTYTPGELFANFFKFQLGHNYFNSNYRKFHNVGNVIPESISYN